MAAPTARFDVLGLGAVAVDDLLYVDEYPPPDAKVRVGQRSRQCGGLTGTALMAAARLGGRCAYGGLLADDEFSQFVRKELDAAGIDTSLAAVRPNGTPAHSTIIVDRVRHTRNVFSFSAGPLGPADDHPPAEAITAARVLLVDHHGLGGTLRAAKIANAAGRPVVADFEREPAGAAGSWVGWIDHLIVSQRYACTHTGLSDARRAASALLESAPTVVVTLGCDGCFFAERSRREVAHLPAFQVTVADTTGCGDVFHGAYALALAEGMALAGRVRFASAAAALKAMHGGGPAGCPTREAVERLLAC